tara:strand:- start:310 stop:660 length:351 start_codon:yes stop_codon:yes gene_type:complete
MSPSSASKDPAAELEALDQLMRALDHPSRRRILLVLRFRGGNMTAGDIAKRFSCSWPSTTRHLKVLLAAGLLRLERQGRERRYHLDPEALAPLERWLRWFGESPPGDPPAEADAER